MGAENARELEELVWGVWVLEERPGGAHEGGVWDGRERDRWCDGGRGF